MIWSLFRYRAWLPGVLLSAALGTVQADDSGRRYGCEKPIRLAWLLNSMLYRDGQGFDPDLVAELQRRSGCRFDAQLVPREEVWRRLADGSLDMLPSGIPNSERRRFSFFVPTIYYRNKLIVRAELASQITTLADFQGVSGVLLGVLPGYWNGPYFEGGVRTLGGQGRVRVYASEEARYGALRRNEVQALISHDINLARWVPADERLDFRILDLNPGPSLGGGLMLSRQTFTAAQAAEWLRLVETMRLDGSLASLVRTHMPEHLVEEFLRSGYRYDVTKRSNTP